MHKKYNVCFVGIIIIFLNCNKLFSEQIGRVDSISNLENISINEKRVLLESELINIEQNSNFQERVNAKIELGDAFKKIGELARAIEIGNAAMYESQKVNDKKLLAFAYLTLGEIYRAVIDREMAVNNLSNALNLYKSINDIIGTAKAYSRLAAVYYEIYCSSAGDQNLMDKFRDSVKLYFNLSNNIAEANLDTSLIIANYNILGALFHAYRMDDSAEYCYQIAIKLTQNPKFESEAPLILWNIGALYYHKQDYQNAIIFGKLGYNLAVKYNVTVISKYTADLLYQSYRELGDSKNALFYLGIAYQISNSIYSSHIASTTLKLQSDFEKEKKEADINSNRKYWIGVASSIAISAILIILGILFFYSKMRKSNEKLRAMNQINKAQNEELHELNITKDKFFSIIAHDLRNPLSAIVQSAEILDTMLDNLSLNEAKEVISLQYQSAKKLHDLLENLLTWARSQRGAIEFQPQEIEVRELLQATQYLLKNQAEKKDIALDINLDNSGTVFADQNMILTVLRNLCSNAIKFTHESGKVRINFEQNEQESIFSVSDNGQGISQADIGKLFNLDVSHTTIGSSGEKGTGLGLILCQEFVIKHRGQIWVDSELGKGSTFYFSLPNAHNKI